MRRRFLAGLTATVCAQLVLSANADESSEPISGLLVDEAIVTPASIGSTAVGRFRLENVSGRTLVLTGAKARWAKAARIVIRGGSGRVDGISALAIKENETLNLQSSHLWVEFIDIVRPLQDGETIDFELVFAAGVVTVSAHVHRD